MKASVIGANQLISRKDFSKKDPDVVRPQRKVHMKTMSSLTTPSVLYNYCPSNHALEILKNLQIKITPPADFNDPFEVNPCIPGVTKTAPHPDLPNPSPQQLEYIEKLPRNIRATASETVAAFCTSVAKDDPLLWAHYADSHRGVAIGFNSAALEAYFSEIQKIIVKFRPLDYTRSRMILTPAVLFDDNRRIEAFVQMCFTKSDVWRYENEFRLLLSLNHFSPTIVNGHPIFLVPIPAATITEVILGVNCSEATARCLRFVLRQGHFATSVRAFHAQLNAAEYKIDLTPFPLI
jgi:hypothetical protein